MLRLSYSQLKLFESCKMNYYFKYVLKLKEKDVETKYMNFGSAMHDCAETYFKDGFLLPTSMAAIWNKYKLHGRMDSALFEKCVTNIQNLGLKAKTVEEMIFTQIGNHNFVGYLDLVVEDPEGIHIIDWKSGTFNNSKVNDYRKQLETYAYLYKIKHGVTPYKCSLYFPKNDRWATFNFTDEQIEARGKWIVETGNKIQQFIEEQNMDNWERNLSSCFFCGYKKECANTATCYDYIIEIHGAGCLLKGDIVPRLNKALDKAMSYNLKDKYWMQQQVAKKYGGLKPRNFADIGTKHLYNVKSHTFGIGHIEKVKKILNDWATYNKEEANIKIVDLREKSNEVYLFDWYGKHELRDYQQQAVNKFVENKTGFLEMATGSGKTLVTSAIISHLSQKTLWIIDRKELLHQSRESFAEDLKLPIGIIGDGECDLQSITVATIQTLDKRRKELKEYLESVDMVIVDEAHHASAETYQRVLMSIPNARYRLGTTATVKRDDGNEMILESMIGPIIYRIGAEELIEQGYLMKPDIVFHKVVHPPLEGSYSDIYEELIVNSNVRNRKIKCIVNSSKPKEKILILVNRIEHGKEIAKDLGEGCYFIHGSLNSEDRKNNFEDFKSDEGYDIMIGTASIFSEGIDIPDLDKIINAAGNKGEVKTIQALGRVLRKSDGKNAATYYDFYDIGNKYLESATKSRIKILEAEGHEVKID